MLQLLDQTIGLKISARVLDPPDPRTNPEPANLKDADDADNSIEPNREPVLICYMLCKSA
jgi:hypothetical protein